MRLNQGGRARPGRDCGASFPPASRTGLGSNCWELFERTATDADAGDRRRVWAYDWRAIAPDKATKGLQQAKECQPQ